MTHGLEELKAMDGEPPADGTLPSAKDLLASGQPLPEGVTPDLPAAMAHDGTDRGHADWLPKTFLRITPLDRSGRRTLWARFELEPIEEDGQLYRYDGKFVELCAGRICS